MTPFDRVRDALAQHGSQPRMSQGQIKARCPAHDDRNPSLSVREVGGKVLLCCFAGCAAADVVAALGLSMADLFSDRYDYVDTLGQVVRTVSRGYDLAGRKTFRQSGIVGGPILYRLPELAAAVAEAQPVYLVEGEKDADTLAGLGLAATSGAQGATNFHLVDVGPLAGAHVVAVVDQDDAGTKWAETVRAKLDGLAGSLRLVAARVGKDASDHVAAGYGPDDFLPWVDAAELVAASWAAVDLGPFLDGSYHPPTPELLPRSDGVCLLYRGLTHSLHGESESGKSLVAQVESVRILAAGGRVLYVDFESDAGAIVARLLEFGATAQQVAAGFTYVRPEVNPRSSAAEAAAFRAHLRQRYDLAVIDGVTDSLGLWGAETKDNDGITSWARELPKAIADRTGAAVVLIDHVTKDSEGRGRFAIGGQAKLATLTGAGYTVEVAQPLGRGLRGVVVLRVAKDRPGYVRGRCGPMRPSDRTQEAARVVIDSTGPAPAVTVEAARTSADPEHHAQAFRPTTLMERVSRYLEQADDGLSFNRINGDVPGREQHVRTALGVLVAEGYVAVEAGARNANLHRSVREYRQRTDPASDVYETGDSQPSPDHLTVSHPYTGGWETDSHRIPETVRETVGDSQTVPLFPPLSWAAVMASGTDDPPEVIE